MKTPPQRPTNKQLVRMLGLSKSYASELVNGKKRPSLEMALKIQEALGYPASEWMTHP